MQMQKDPSSEICHPAHPEHKLKLMTTAAGEAPFFCDGCKEPGYGPRGGQSLNLHTCCALAVADDPLFGLPTLVQPLFGYGKQFEFRFLYELPPPIDDDRMCDACGQPTRGYVYHCSEQDVHLHPCCVSLPDRFLHDGCAFDLHRKPSRPCVLCAKNKCRSRWSWAYRCYYVNGHAVDLHVACLKETARRCWDWEANYRKQDVGGGALNVESIVENLFTNIGFGKFGEIAGTVASFILALVLGNPIERM